MSKSIHQPKIHITRSEGDATRIHCVVETPAGGGPGIRSGVSPSLIADFSRPTMVGFQWPPSGDHEPEQDEDFSAQLITPGSSRERFSFSYQLEAETEVAAFFPPIDSPYDPEVKGPWPPGETSYHTEIEVPQSIETLWLPLPYGRSLHMLDRPLDFDGENLHNFVSNWFCEREEESRFSFDLDDVQDRFDEAGYYIFCESPTTHATNRILIPAELLRDPIRNGSYWLNHGFNPRNEEQKARIGSHLEGELPRLLEFFQGKLLLA